MGKDPAFLFYPGDWLGGTMGMTFEEKGAYMELLMLQFNRGHMSGQVIGQTVGQVWERISFKFEIDEAGLFYNSRLELEVNRRKRFVESRYNNVSGTNQYTKKTGHKKGHMTSHMENEDENIIENRKRKPFVIPKIEEVAKFFDDNGYKPEVGRDKWHYYNDANWFDSKGSPVLNWKQKMRSVWFKEENRKPIPVSFGTPGIDLKTIR